MTQPAAYEPSTSFDSFNPSSFPNLGRKLDVELENVATTTDEIRTNLALIQRDDGALANASVGRDQLKNEVAMGVGTPGIWATATEYSPRDSVIVSGVWYWCAAAHTSGVFATDLSAGKWEEIVDFTAFIADLALGDATPIAISDSAGSAGVSDFAAREDHVHPYTDPPALAALTGVLTGTITSGTTAMTDKRRYRITGGTGTLPTMAAGSFVVAELRPAAGVTATVGRNSQTIDGAAEDDTFVGDGGAGVVVLYSYSAAGAVRSQIIGSVL